MIVCRLIDVTFNRLFFFAIVRLFLSSETGYNLRCVKASPNTFVNLTVEQVQRCLKNTQVNS